MRHLVPERVLTYLPVKELIFIGNRELCDTVNEDISQIYKGLPIRSLLEDDLVKRQPVIDYIKARVSGIDEELLSKVRCGWYYQQFLKMSFCKMCDEEYYLSWDMDTVPIRNIELFEDNDKPIFGMKNEHNPGYFITITNLLGISKQTDGSFISEHMLFRKDYMQKLIEKIDSSEVSGDNYCDKIINAIDDDYIALGFSEFETYGSFVLDRFPGSYVQKEFHSFRRGSWFVNENELNEDDIKWLAGDYDAVTFENTKQISDMVKLFRNQKYRNSMTARKFYETILESGYFGDYSDGRIDAGDWYAPV